jgi:galactokinase
MLGAMDGADHAVRARAPGRVNLIGDHTDYNGGLALPMAVDLRTEVVFVPDDEPRLELRSDLESAPAVVDLHTPLEPSHLAGIQPEWARYVAAVAAVVPAITGGTGTVRSSVPAGAGLSSSAALEVALALAFGGASDPVPLARACQRAEQAATGVPSGIMDQLTVIGARQGHALLIDFSDLRFRPVPIPDDVEVIVVHSGTTRRLASTAYATRRAECEAAVAQVGPLAEATLGEVQAIADPVLRRRARHVVTECERVISVADALTSGDRRGAGAAMSASHRSLAEDFEVSTPQVDALVADLVTRPGVDGARITGAGFGGCVVALAAPGAVDPADFPTPAWRVRAGAGASVDGDPARGQS